MMHASLPGSGRSFDFGLRLFLVLVIFLPAFAFLVGFVNGHPAFILYREPKLVAIMGLGWASWPWRPGA